MRGIDGYDDARGGVDSSNGGASEGKGRARLEVAGE
jgi:hypothetical protein